MNGPGTRERCEKKARWIRVDIKRITAVEVRRIGEAEERLNSAMINGSFGLPGSNRDYKEQFLCFLNYITYFALHCSRVPWLQVKMLRGNCWRE